MHSLLYREFSMQSWSILFYPFFFWICCIWEGEHGSSDFSLIAIIIMNSYIVLLFNSFKNERDLLVMSLPVTRKQLLQSKYIGSMLVGFILMLTLAGLNQLMGNLFDVHLQMNYWGIYLGIWFPIVVGIPLLCYPKVNGWVSTIVQMIFLLFFLYFVDYLKGMGWFVGFAMSIFPLLLMPFSWLMANNWYQQKEY